MNSNEDLFECSCCGKIQLPGEKETRPFLQAAEQVLLDYIDKSCLFDIDKLVLVPEVIGKIGSQGLHGFEAEYKVYNQLKQLTLPIYIFYSLKPNNKTEELGDFLLITKSSIIVLEVKARKLNENASKQDLEKFLKETILKEGKKKTQKDRVSEDIRKFLARHNSSESPTIHYFYLFVNSNCPKPTDSNFEFFDSNVILKNNTLFQDNYLQEVTQLCTEEVESVSMDEKCNYSIRTLLAWFYGSHLSYLNISKDVFNESKGLMIQWNILSPSENIKKLLDEEYKPKSPKKYKREENKKKNKNNQETNKDIAGIFLTPLQKVIAECDLPFLQIIGLPGTGKTYILILKMVRVFLELWQSHKKQNKEMKEVIIVYHRNEKTLRFIQNTFWQTIKKHIEIQKGNNKQEIHFKELTLSKLIRFIGGKRPTVQSMCSSYSKELFQVEQYVLGTKFKVFCDDVGSCHAELFLGVFTDNQHGLFEIIKAIQQSNFCWITSYSIVPPVKNVYCPLSCLRVNGQEIYDSSRYVHLTDSLRYTGSIHAILNQLYTSSSSKYRERISSLDFRPGTQVIGEKPQFISVKDCSTMKAKVQELLHKLDKEGFERKEIAVIRTDKMRDEVKFRMEMFKSVMGCAKKDDRITPNFLRDLEYLMNTLNIGDEDLEIEDAHLISTAHEQSHIGETFSLRGIEFNHVIICVLNNSFSFPDRDKIISETWSLYNRMSKERGSFFPISARINVEFINLMNYLNSSFDEENLYNLMDDLTETISRAVTSATVVYKDGNKLLAEIADRFKTCSPEICPDSSYKKKYESEKIFRENGRLNLVEIYNSPCLDWMFPFYFLYFRYHFVRAESHKKNYKKNS
ncbi:uncharacterized protein LOC136042839 [Artemia franciscana]|uniref:uncharacterized protein LOC136042839 n=1 Tax=Artemia franciscana TaxID=6661 RepID=UPI0032DB6204